MFVGECLRPLPEEKRGLWPQELPKISFAANACENSSLGEGVSPFQVEHGRVCRLPFDAQFVEPVSARSERKLDSVYGQLAAASALYRGIAFQSNAAARAASMERLNERGSPGKKMVYKLGSCQHQKRVVRIRSRQLGRLNICFNGAVPVR